MPQPLRRVRQRIPKDAIRPPRVLLHLPFLGVAALLVVFAVAVGWAFFMGVIIGQGQNPAERVNAILHEPSPKVTPPPSATAGEMVAELLDRPLPLRKVGKKETSETADGSNGADASPTADAGEQSGPQDGTSRGQADENQTAQAAPEQSKASAYPFSRPQGESLAAWGIQPGGAAKPAPQSAPQERAKARPAEQETSAASRRTEGRAEQKAAPKTEPKAEPRFDYVYQAAAFRGKNDGDALRARLEEKGLRTRLQKSGKVYLVQVLLRGSEREAENVRETLRRLGLGKPIRLSKTAVK